MKRRIALIAAALLLLGIGASIAYASIPGPDGVIHGCYKTNNPAQGGVIVIDSAATCPSGFAPLNWNQMGPQGPPGLLGVEYVEHVQSQGPAIPGAVLGLSVSCPPGKSPIGGGGHVDPLGGMNNIVMKASWAYAPPGSGGSWNVQFENVGTQDRGNLTVHAFATCAILS